MDINVIDNLLITNEDFVTLIMPACTTICNRVQNALTDFDQKFYCIDTMIVGFSSEISLDLDQF